MLKTLIYMHRPLILVTNDDGITAPGIRNLVSFMNEIGEVVVVAPNSPQSGKGHAITINSTLTFEEINLEGPQKDYSLSGTPVDCVKFALDKILTRKPDLLKQSAPFTEHIAEITSLQGDCRIAFLYNDILSVSVLFF